MKRILALAIAAAALLTLTTSCLLSLLLNDEPSGTNNAVDLGLSVKWATCNLGASSPEESGSFYAWGETKAKDKFTWSNYKWTYEEKSTYGDPILLRSKYNSNSNLGKVDKKTKLDTDDDAARSKLGGKWRMPTKAELQELIDKCDMTWTTKNGVKGMEIKSKSNGNSIFIPAAGLYGPVGNTNPTGGDKSEVGKSCYVWSSQCGTDGQVMALCLKSNYKGILNAGRDQGLTIRPVCD